MNVRPFEVTVPPRDPERFRALLPPARMAAFEHALEEGRKLLEGHVVWNVNSTAKGGGVVELLRPLVGYARGAGADTRWVVIGGTPDFFAITKRIHNRLHGAEGDGGALDDGARRTYESVLEANLAAFPGHVRAGDVVIVHDPQPAGLIDALKARGAAVVWRCHVGIDTANDRTREAWAFLRPYVAGADRYVFSRESFVWEGLDRERVVVIHPTIDAFAPKNVDIDDATVRAILAITGLVPNGGVPRSVTFERQDGTREAWAFLRPYVAGADRYVFSRESFVWEGLDRERVVVIHPTIDAFAPKNVDIDDATVRAILAITGLVPNGGVPRSVTFERQDGTRGRVERGARIVEDEPLEPGTPVVLQVSRWDALKDPLGVIRGFAHHVPADTGAHLVYAAPDVASVADDPEGERLLRAAIAARDALHPTSRRRIHLASLPMDDLDENAMMVNALQRHARIVVQKSLAEGFGLTVAEAMWKARPVVASRIGGIQEQIVDGDSGVLLDDPTDLAGFGAAITALLDDEARAERMGRRARERVRDDFLNVRALEDYIDVIRALVPAPVAATSARPQ